MDIQKMIDDYANWLKSEITVVKYGEYYELTTPYLDRFNDYLQIYVKQENDGIISMTDDGYIIGNLLSSGITLKNGSNRKIMLDKIIRNFSLQLNGDEIITTATSANFPQKKHFMVQAMLMIDDMFEVSSEKVKSFFLEDISNFLNANDIFFSTNIPLIGKTGNVNVYDFLFQRSRNKPERFCKAINNINVSKRDLTIFNWIDTQETRDRDTELIVILNDENTIDDKDINAFNSYNIKPLKFSERQQHVSLFAA